MVGSLWPKPERLPEEGFVLQSVPAGPTSCQESQAIARTRTAPDTQPSGESTRVSAGSEMPFSFQIKELTGNLSRNSPSSSLSPGSGGTDSDSSFPPTPTAERSTAIAVKDQRKAIRTLLAWVQRKTRK